MGRQTYVYDEERSSWSSVISDDLVQGDDQKKSVKDGTSQLQNFRVNFHKFHALSQLGYAITNFAQNAGNDFSLNFS
jgi:hypothetical protein